MGLGWVLKVGSLILVNRPCAVPAGERHSDIAEGFTVPMASQSCDKVVDGVDDVRWLGDNGVFAFIGEVDGVKVFDAVGWQVVVDVGWFDSVFAWGARRCTCASSVELLIGKRCWESWFGGEYGLVVEREGRDFWFRKEFVEGLVCVVWEGREEGVGGGKSAGTFNVVVCLGEAVVRGEIHLSARAGLSQCEARRDS